MIFLGKDIKACIFDLDGTLLDSCSIWEEVDDHFFSKRGMVRPADYGKEIGPLGLEKAAIYSINRFHLNETKESVMKEWLDDVTKIYENEVELKPHARELLEYLKKNKVELFVATANSKECYEPALKRNNILKYFSYIENTQNYPLGKKDPTIYLDLAKKANVDPKNIIVFEDIMIGLENAKKAGFITCAVYEETSSEEKEKKKLADFYCEDFIELIKE